MAQIRNRQKPLGYALASGLLAVVTFWTVFLVLQIYVAVATNGPDVEGPSLELGATVAAYLAAGFIFGRRYTYRFGYSLVALIPLGMFLVAPIVTVGRVSIPLATKLVVGGGVAFLCHWLGSQVGHRATRRKRPKAGNLGLE